MKESLAQMENEAQECMTPHRESGVVKEPEELCWGPEEHNTWGENGLVKADQLGGLSTKARATFKMWLSVIKDTLCDQDWCLLLMLSGWEKRETMQVSS